MEGVNLHNLYLFHVCIVNLVLIAIMFMKQYNQLSHEVDGESLTEINSSSNVTNCSLFL